MPLLYFTSEIKDWSVEAEQAAIDQEDDEGSDGGGDTASSLSECNSDNLEAKGMMNFDEIVMVSEDDEQNEDMNEIMKFVRSRTNRWVESHCVFTNPIPLCDFNKLLTHFYLSNSYKFVKRKS